MLKHDYVFFVHRFPQKKELYSFFLILHPFKTNFFVGKNSASEILSFLNIKRWSRIFLF